MVNLNKTKREEVSEIVKSLNDCLERRWSRRQLSDGMDFEFREEWLRFAPYLLKKYRSAGWYVHLHVEIIPHRRAYVLKFRHPDHIH